MRLKKLLKYMSCLTRIHLIIIPNHLDISVLVNDIYIYHRRWLKYKVQKVYVDKDNLFCIEVY